MVANLPDRMRSAELRSLVELGLASALELEDDKAVESLAARLPPYHRAALGAAEWLLRRDRAYGARIAERALEAVDHERVREGEIDRERFADLTFWFAIHEAEALRFDSALGLLERAVAFGFDDLDRLEAEGRFATLFERARFVALVDRLRGAAPS